MFCLPSAVACQGLVQHCTERDGQPWGDHRLAVGIVTIEPINALSVSDGARMGIVSKICIFHFEHHHVNIHILLL